jgi:glycine/D-amino acid oxidase-like deaminating enzyme
MAKASQSPVSPGITVHIIGLGLAGALTAHELRARGCAVRVYDAPLPGAASPMAPGLINPLAGRKLQMDPRFPELRAAAVASYTALEALLGRRIWHPLPIVRIIESAAQAQALERARRGPAADWIGEPLAPGALAWVRRDDWGGTVTLGGGWVDIAALVNGLRACLDADRALVPAVAESGMFAPDDVVVNCAGWRAAADPDWSWLPYNPAKGELLRLRFAEPPAADAIYNRGIWLQPLADGTWRAGARYDWAEMDGVPTEAGRAALERRLREWCALSWEVVAQEAGVRPVMRDYLPMIGRHPERPTRYILGGLGSKGALWAPWLARRLADLLTAAVEPPAAVSVGRWGGSL